MASLSSSKLSVASYSQILQMLLNLGLINAEQYIAIVERMPASLLEKDKALVAKETQLSKLLVTLQSEYLTLMQKIEQLRLEAHEIDCDIEELKKRRRHAVAAQQEEQEEQAEQLEKEMQQLQAQYNKVCDELARKVGQQLSLNDQQLAKLQSELSGLQQEHLAGLQQEADDYANASEEAASDIEQKLATEPALHTISETQRKELAKTVMSGPTAREERQQLERLVPEQYRPKVEQNQAANFHVAMMQLKFRTAVMGIIEEMEARDTAVKATNATFNALQVKMVAVTIVSQRRHESIENKINTIEKQVTQLQNKYTVLKERLQDLEQGQAQLRTQSSFIASRYHYGELSPRPMSTPHLEIKSAGNKVK